MNLEPEYDDGRIEYKLNLDNMSSFKFQKYISQMRYRLQEGNGTAIYVIGVLDSGIIYGLNRLQILTAIRVFKKMSKKNSANIKIILNCTYKNRHFIIIKAYSFKYTEQNLNYLTF